MIVVPTNILLDQTVSKILEFNLGLEVGTVNSKSKTFGKQTTVITYASFVSQINKGTIKPEEFDVLFLDEAHRSLTDPIQESIDKFRRENKLIINFTATDKYDETKKLSSEIIYEMSINEAVTEGLLCGIKCIFVKTNISLSDAKVSKSGEYNADDLNKILQNGEVLSSCIEVYSELFKDQTVAIYVNSTDQADKLAEDFNAIYGHGYAVALHGKTDDEERVKSDISNGKSKVIIGVRKIIDGFDEPRITGVIRPFPSTSVVKVTQSAGRGLRLDPDDPNKVCKVVEYVYEDTAIYQVTFPDILGQTEIYPQNSIRNSKPKHTESHLNSDLNDKDVPIGSFKIITNTTTVFELTQELKPVNTQESELRWTEIVKIIRENNIVSSSEYQVNYLRLGLPRYATLKNHKEWTNPRDFFGNKDDLTLRQVKVILEKNNITTEAEYLKIEEKLRLPNLDRLKVKPDWWGFDNLINGVEKPLSEYSRIAVESGIQNQRDYKTRYNQIPGLVTYDRLVQLPGWTNLSDFLASEKDNNLNYHSQLARNAKIKSKNDYNNRYKSIPGLLSIFRLERFQDWTTWDEFLGLKRLTLGEMSAIARSYNIKSAREYQQKSGKIEGLISHQIITKMAHWPGFKKFLEGDLEEL